MKKYLVILVALVMVLGLSGMAMAALDSKTIAVTASVADFAEITSVTITVDPFSGAANELKSGSGVIHVEANRNVSTAVSTTNLSQIIGLVTYTIPTTVTIGGGSSVSQGISGGKAAHTVTVSGTTGAISAQAAGSYSATVTVTVSSSI